MTSLTESSVDEEPFCVLISNRVVSYPMPGALLYCPIRGPLTAESLAKDGLTPTEEARRVDFLHFLLEERSYPPDHVGVETVVLKNIGAGGKNKLRADVIAYDAPVEIYAKTPLAERLQHAVLVAEIKRESKSKSSGVTHQLEPALTLLPGLSALGVYWDDENRDLFYKELVEQDGAQRIVVRSDTVANLPPWGQEYKSKPVIVDNLTQPANLVATLFGLANIMRSHHVNDEPLRYRETVKLLLARYVDERQARGKADRTVRLQVYPGQDPTFMERVKAVYLDSSVRYSRAETLFSPVATSELDERVLRPLVESIQGFDLSSASNDTMQQVFMSFVPTVFKKTLSQYFTPVSLIETVVAMVGIGPTDKICDPAMGTGDFLTAAMSVRSEDNDITQRVFGIDSDNKAFDLAVVNMILSRDGQSGLECEDSIRNPTRWAEEMDVVLCNPPFGSRTIEENQHALAQYDLGHAWRKNGDVWSMTDDVLASQQLGILFIERCWKMLRPDGRLGIILPEGYLSTDAYTFVRQWMIDHLRLVALIELPRRIFSKSDADLRSNILIATKLAPNAKNSDYPIYASLVRKVGYKLGGDFAASPRRDEETGLELRDDHNQVILDSDFHRTLDEFALFQKTRPRQWSGGHYSDIAERVDLDMKPRRLVPKALKVMRSIKAVEYVRLGDIADVVEETVDLLSEVGPSAFRRPVEGQNIRAVEGIVSPQFPERCWSIAQRKTARVYQLKRGDIIVGLVRPERRNVGVLLEWGDDIVGVRDALAVVRVRHEHIPEYPQEWLFAVLRSEECRIQFWTEAGGTSYGKLDLDQIRNLLLPSTPAGRLEASVAARKWMDAVEQMHESWTNVGTDDDRRPIINSPLTGLIDDDENEFENVENLA
jgi:type I restriction enzyme M protein